MARSEPSGVHSASRTCSMSGRGAPPSIEARASVPVPIQPSNACPREMAISPVRDTDSTCASGMFTRTVSVLSVRVMNVRTGSPSHAAPYTIVRPSGPKRASRTVPRSKVSRRKVGRRRRGGHVAANRHPHGKRADDGAGREHQPSRVAFGRRRRDRGDGTRRRLVVCRLVSSANAEIARRLKPLLGPFLEAAVHDPRDAGWQRRRPRRGRAGPLEGSPSSSRPRSRG